MQKYDPHTTATRLAAFFHATHTHTPTFPLRTQAPENISRVHSHTTYGAQRTAQWARLQLVDGLSVAGAGVGGGEALLQAIVLLLQAGHLHQGLALQDVGDGGHRGRLLQRRDLGLQRLLLAGVPRVQVLPGLRTHAGVIESHAGSGHCRVAHVAHAPWVPTRVRY